MIEPPRRRRRSSPSDTQPEAEHGVRGRRPSGPTGVAWLVLLVGLVIAVTVSSAWAGGQRRIAEARLGGRTAEAASGVASRVDDIVEVASAVGGLYESSEALTSAELRRFLNVLSGGRSLDEQVPGLAGVLVVRQEGARIVIEEAFPSQVEATVDSEALSGTRNVRESLARSTDLAVAVTSAPIPQERRNELRADLVVAVPVYREADARASTAALERRRAALERWVLALVDVDALLEEVAPAAGRSVALVALDGPSVAEGTRLGSTPVGHRVGAGDEELARTVVVNLRDTSWLLRVEALPGFRTSFERAQPWLVLVTGLILAALMFALIYVLATSRDRALALVDRRTAELEQRNAELNRFTGMVSHDLKSPLTGVLGFLELLGQDRMELGEKERSFVLSALRSAERMRDLIDRLLDYARGGRTLGEVERVDLARIVDDLRTDHAVRLADRGGVLDIGELPTVEGDPARLAQVLQNLVSNAVKFVPEDRPPHVRVSAREVGDTWVITVADNGVGIAPEDREAAIRPFERTERTRSYEGTGLGLAICDRIARAHGGRLELDDSDLGGTAARVVLPKHHGDRTGADTEPVVSA